MKHEFTWTPTEDIPLRFPNLNPIRKALELAKGRAHGIGTRRLAVLFSIGESTVRNLLDLLLLPHEDQSAIEAGAPYRRYLRKAAAIRTEERKAEKIRIVSEHERVAKQGVEVIRWFFREADVMEAYAEPALREALAYIRGGELDGNVKPSEVLWDDRIEAILTFTRPRELDTLTNIDWFNGVVEWLCNLLVRVMPNSQVRERGIELALAEPRQLGW